MTKESILLKENISFHLFFFTFFEEFNFVAAEIHTINSKRISSLPAQINNKTKKTRLILQSGIYNLLTNISEGTAFLLQGLT